RTSMPRRHRFPVALIVALATLAAASTTMAQAPAPKNVIIMFADGAAPAQFDFGRHSSHVLRKQPFVTTDVVLRDGPLGLLVTSPPNVDGTDSAAAASAMSTGVKVVNGAVAMTPDGASPRTVMEAAKAAGKRVGLVTTATVYDATPAGFALHAKSRRDSQILV